jgi:hypothetical protein
MSKEDEILNYSNYSIDCDMNDKGEMLINESFRDARGTLIKRLLGEMVDTKEKAVRDCLIRHYSAWMDSTNEFEAIRKHPMASVACLKGAELSS